MTPKIIHPIAHELGLIKERLERVEEPFTSCQAELLTAKWENIRLREELGRVKPFRLQKTFSRPQELPSRSLKFSQPRPDSACYQPPPVISPCKMTSTASSSESTATTSQSGSISFSTPFSSTKSSSQSLSSSSNKRSTPSYAVPTASSLRRSQIPIISTNGFPAETSPIIISSKSEIFAWKWTQNPTASEWSGTSYGTYQDGRLVMKAARYLTHTSASSAKCRRKWTSVKDAGLPDVSGKMSKYRGRIDGEAQAHSFTGKRRRSSAGDQGILPPLWGRGHEHRSDVRLR